MVMDEEDHRWTLPDWKSTLKWCKKRNGQSIRCTIDVLGENSKDEEEVGHFVTEYKNVIRSIFEERIKAATSIKLTALGANFDKKVCTNSALELYTEARLNRVPYEMDMEGAPLVDTTLDTAYHISSDAFPATLALQAYLNRSTADLYSLMEKGVKVRLVKGAYLGDVDMFSFIQERFKFLFIILMDSGNPFSVGTHDPELIEWIKERMENNKNQMEFGFLKGLADETKIELVDEGWFVSEYVPFGSESAAYESRRKKYLNNLEKLGKCPAP
jgi:proline dehydrogenase